MKNKFLLADGIPDTAAIADWAEEYYQGLMNLVNGFYARADMKAVLESMSSIPFDQFVARELEGASEEVIGIATTLVKEIADREIEYINAYMKWID